jgi:hypothetical protein
VVEVSSSGTQATIATGLLAPTSVSVDAAGDVYVVAGGEVVEITPSGGQSMIGTGLNNPYNASLDGAGDVFIADYSNNRIVKVQQSQPPPSFDFASTLVYVQGVDAFTVQNIGNQSLSLASLNVSGTFFGQEASSGPLKDCIAPLSLTAGASCNVSIFFMSESTSTVSGSAALTDNSLNSTSATQTIKLTGTGVPIQPNLVFNLPPNVPLGMSIPAFASSNSSGAITYSLVSGPATISGNTITTTGTGTVTVQASPVAAGNYTAATAQTSFTVIPN